MKANEWVGTWPDGSTVWIHDDVWETDGAAADELRLAVTDAAVNGWPRLAGWQIDQSPGFDDEWNYLRLVALGAKHVEGPFPQAAETVDSGLETDVVVG